MSASATPTTANSLSNGRTKLTPGCILLLPPLRLFGRPLLTGHFFGLLLCSELLLILHLRDLRLPGGFGLARRFGAGTRVFGVGTRVFGVGTRVFGVGTLNAILTRQPRNRGCGKRAGRKAEDKRTKRAPATAVKTKPPPS